MKAIWKFQLRNAYPRVAMPQGAEILSAHEQNGEICLWAMVNPDAPFVDRNFVILGTGEESSSEFAAQLKFIGTTLINSGRFVFHVFEKLDCQVAGEGDAK